MLGEFQFLCETNTSMTLWPRPYPVCAGGPESDINYQLSVKSFLTPLTPPCWAGLRQNELNLGIIIILEKTSRRGKYLEKYLENISKNN